MALRPSSKSVNRKSGSDFSVTDMSKCLWVMGLALGVSSTATVVVDSPATLSATLRKEVDSPVATFRIPELFRVRQAATMLLRS